MQSELERTNSWAPFVMRLEKSLLKKDFRVSTLRSIFRFIDPEFDQEFIGVWRTLQYLLFWNTTERGRICRYEVSFAALMQQKRELFKESPQLVIETFN